MAEIDGGALSFNSVMDNEQMNSAIEETLRRVQGLSDGTVAGSKKIDAAFDMMAANIEEGFRFIDTMADTHQMALKNLENEYKQLGEDAANAFYQGKSKKGNSLLEKQKEVGGEIELRKQLIKEVENTADALQKEEQKLNKMREQAEKTANAHVSFRTRINELKEEMKLLIDRGIDEQSEAYKRLEAELGRLTDIQNDVSQQARVLANDEGMMQGVISGLSGVAGGFSAVTGTMSLFAGENENLQKIMVKVQSLMAITIGLQQVSQTLNKDSAFRLVTLAKAQQLVGATSLSLGKAFIKMGLSATAAKIAVTALYATFTLGLSLAISGVIALIDRHNKKQEETKKQAEKLAEANKKQEERLDGLAKKYAEQAATIQTYRNALDSENLSHNDKLKIIKKLQEIIPDYTAKLNNEGKVIWDNKAAIDAYLGSLEKSLKFKAAMEDLTAIYTEIYKLESKPKPQTSTTTFSFNETTSTITDYNALAQKHGLKNADGISSDILEQWQKEEEFLLNLQKDLDDKQMAELQNKIKNIQEYISKNGLLDLKLSTEKGNNGKDAFSVMLEERKKRYDEYFKWLNADLQKEAQTEFATLLENGKTYKEYLQSMLDSGKLTKEQIHQVTNEIAGETNKTVLEAFNTELSDQLNNAKTTIEMLNIIAQRRKDLKNDGTDLYNSKKDTLDAAQKNALAKQKQETNQLLQEYSSYLNKKIKLETDYNNDLALLEKRRSEATTDADRAKIDRAITNRTKQYEKDTKGTGDTDYDAMVQEYANFEQKKQAIIDEYDEKREKAMEHNNQQLVVELNKAQAKALSNLAIDEMQTNPNWEKMFGSLDEISTKKLEELLSMIEGQTAFLGVEFDPKDFETIKAKIEGIKNEIQERNPFKSLIFGIRDYGKAIDDESKKKALTNTFESASQAIQLVSDALDSVVGGLETMGVEMNESTQQVMKDIGGILDGAANLAQGLATGNPLAIIQGSISIISSGIDLIFGAHDRKAEKSIKKHADAVNRLETAYTALSWTIDKALGGAVYKSQQAAIDNMEAQRKHLQAMWQAEESKKKTDLGKVNEYKDQYDQLGRDIQDMLDEISNDILQTDAKTFADELGDAFVSAFAKGEDAANAFGETVDNVIKQAVLNQLKKNFLEKQLQGALDGLEKSMGYWNGNEFIFDSLTDAEIEAFKNQVSGITGQFNQAMEAYSELFKEIVPEDEDTSLTGAVKGVSEETASLVAGQMNAIRINQMEATAILRQQLMHLATIAQNTSYNHFLQSIDERLGRMENAADSLRSKGLS